MYNGEITLVLFGRFYPQKSSDMRPFWLKFIELQHKLPTSKKVHQIVSHSWNPELTELSRLVYAPHAECHEKQPSFNMEFLQINEPSISSKLSLNRLAPIWKFKSFQSILSIAQSRARAVKLMDELSSRQGQVVMTTWELEKMIGVQVNQLVIDSSLPEDYLYLPYSSRVDKGYGEMWLVAPWAIARRFRDFDTFVLDALTGKNLYLKELSKFGWPRSIKKTQTNAALSHPVWQHAKLRASRFSGKALSWAQGNTLAERILRRLTAPIHRFLTEPALTAENSYVMRFKAAPRTFPLSMALNIQMLLKYFIHSSGLRERTRFLTDEDFEISMFSGQLINPQPFVLIIWDNVNVEKALTRLEASSPLPLESVYFLGNRSVRAWTSTRDGSGITRVLADSSGSDCERLSSALSDIVNQFGETIPILLMPTITVFINCDDWFYLNALLKYIAWSKRPYVNLKAGRIVKADMEFPDLFTTKGRGAFSLEMAAGTAVGMLPFLKAKDRALVDPHSRAEKMMIELPAIVREGGLF